MSAILDFVLPIQFMCQFLGRTWSRKRWVSHLNFDSYMSASLAICISGLWSVILDFQLPVLGLDVSNSSMKSDPRNGGSAVEIFSLSCVEAEIAKDSCNLQ